MSRAISELHDFCGRYNNIITKINYIIERLFERQRHLNNYFSAKYLIVLPALTLRGITSSRWSNSWVLILSAHTIPLGLKIYLRYLQRDFGLFASVRFNRYGERRGECLNELIIDVVRFLSRRKLSIRLVIYSMHICITIVQLTKKCTRKRQV